MEADNGEVMKVALHHKEEGNLKFKAQKLKEAQGHYEDAVKSL